MRATWKCSQVNSSIEIHCYNDVVAVVGVVIAPPLVATNLSKSISMISLLSSAASNSGARSLVSANPIERTQTSIINNNRNVQHGKESDEQHTNEQYRRIIIMVISAPSKSQLAIAWPASNASRMSNESTMPNNGNKTKQIWNMNRKQNRSAKNQHCLPWVQRKWTACTQTEYVLCCYSGSLFHFPIWQPSRQVYFICNRCRTRHNNIQLSRSNGRNLGTATHLCDLELEHSNNNKM